MEPLGACSGSPRSGGLAGALLAQLPEDRERVAPLELVAAHEQRETRTEVERRRPDMAREQPLQRAEHEPEPHHVHGEVPRVAVVGPERLQHLLCVDPLTHDPTSSKTGVKPRTSVTNTNSAASSPTVSSVCSTFAPRWNQSPADI